MNFKNGLALAKLSNAEDVKFPYKHLGLQNITATSLVVIFADNHEIFEHLP